MKILDVLGKKRIIADGGLGTQLQAAGLPAGASPLLWNMTHPDAVRAIHRAYLQAGAELLTTNTFGADALHLAATDYSVAEVVAAGVTLAKEARDEQGGTAFVALDIGPLGQLIGSFGQRTFDEAVALFKEQVEAGERAGADCVLIETMIDTYELKAAILAAREASSLPILATVALNGHGRMLNGADVDCVCVLLESLGVAALGLNCGSGPAELAHFVEHLSTIAATPVIFSPNAGAPAVEDGATVYPTSPAAFAAQMQPLLAAGVAVAGGCCGTTPEHIRALASAVALMSPLSAASEPLSKRRQRISSYSAVVDLDTAIEQSGFLIDPRTDVEIARAMEQKDYESVVDAVFDAQGEGAKYLTVCTAHEGICEPEVLPALVQVIQSMVNMPLVLLSSSLDALEKALRLYNGCAGVDLSLLAQDEQEKAQALAKKYGAVCLQTAR